MKVPESMKKRIASYAEQIMEMTKEGAQKEGVRLSTAECEKLKEMYEKCYPNTWETVLEPCEDGSCFVLTGDIPAMWLRDSTAQVTHYLPLTQDKEVSDIIEGVLKRQFMYIGIDPYANSFNREPSGACYAEDIPRQKPWVWECKYEIDSLCYPIRLCYMYWKQTGKTEFIKAELAKTVRIILDVWRTEQHHMEKSPYRFTRPNPGCPWSTIYNNGMGAPVSYTGMIWSGFRPSDDGCEYGYLVASNMFAVVTLGYMSEMLEKVCGEYELAAECRELRSVVDEAIHKYGTIEHEKYGRIYVCETDGMGHYNLLDDANIPSLLSIPYIGYAPVDDELYQNTRRFLFSSDNPYYFEGKAAKGIGSRHTPDRYIWHMALVMQGLTSTSRDEKTEMLKMLVRTDAGTGYLHEGFDADDPYTFTREWFTWPNSLFCEFVEKYLEE